MAVRQYIGARYVPLYAGDWDATKNYEPLTIVTDGNGNSYTSLKDVPNGIDLTNRDYWIMSSSFSSSIDILRRQVSEVQDDLEAITSKVTTNEEHISSNANMIETLRQGTSNFITPEQFGAKGDGSADDTEAFKECLLHASVNNLSVYAGGSYLISSTLEIYNNFYIGQFLIFNRIIYSGSSYAMKLYGRAIAIKGNIITATDGTCCKIGDNVQGAQSILFDVAVLKGKTCLELEAGSEHNVQDCVLQITRAVYDVNAIKLNQSLRYVGEIDIIGTWFTAGDLAHSAGYAITSDCSNYGCTGLTLIGVSFEGSKGGIEILNTSSSTATVRDFAPLKIFSARVSEMVTNDNQTFIKKTGNGRLYGTVDCDYLNLKGLEIESATDSTSYLTLTGRIRAVSSATFSPSVNVYSSDKYVQKLPDTSDYVTTERTYTDDILPSGKIIRSTANLIFNFSRLLLASPLYVISAGNITATINGSAFTLSNGAGVEIIPYLIGADIRYLIKKFDDVTILNPSK